MLKTRYLKLLRDIRVEKSKFVLMIAAISISLIGIGAVLSAFTILSREIDKNYALTLPASATLETPDIDDALVNTVRSKPGIIAAEARSTILARILSMDGQWQPILLFVITDFNNMTLARFRRETGQWPPQDGTLVLERMALDLYGTAVGRSVIIKIPEGSNKTITVSLSVHDPSLAPAWQGGVGYGYISRETLITLGGTGQTGELKVIFDQRHPTIESVTTAALELASWLKIQGHEVNEIQVPPPFEHPHQAQLSALLMLLFIFSLCALILGSILSASVISALMAKEINNIGIMKAIGGSSHQISLIYFTLVFSVSAMAAVPGLTVGIFLGRNFALMASQLLNVTLFSTAVPWWVYAIQLGTGFIVPMLIAGIPILTVINRTVREALQDSGIASPLRNQRKPRAFFLLLGKLDRAFILSVRNTFRKKGRILLTTGLLMAAGAMFMMTLNVQTAWDNNLNTSFSTRKYDFEIRLNKGSLIAETEKLLSEIPGVLKAEGWGLAPGSLSQAGEGLAVSHTYPDAGHGVFSLIGVPEGSTLVNFPLIAGKWLDDNSAGGIVLNPQGVALLGLTKPQIGDMLNLSANGQVFSWRIIGLVNEVGMGAGYINRNDFESAVSRPGKASAFRVVTEAGTPEENATIIQDIESAFSNAGLSIAAILVDSEFQSEVSDHIFLLILALLLMAILMAIVGLLGLASTIGTNILERKKEFGVMRAIGATPASLIRNVIGESVFIALLSLVLALITSIPLSLIIGKTLGYMAFGTPLTLQISSQGITLWLAISILGSLASSAVPAWQASRTTVREALAYE